MDNPSLPRPVQRADRTNLTTEEEMITRILDAPEGAASYGIDEAAPTLAPDEGPNPDPVTNPHQPIFDSSLPVDERVTSYYTTDKQPVSPETPQFSNPLDPVSPQIGTESPGAEDANPSDVHAFPDDPTAAPAPAPAPAPPPPAPAPAPAPASTMSKLKAAVTGDKKGKDEK